MNEWRAAEMYGHMQVCPHCGRLDTTVRRALLVARNLPPIQPSREFLPRLEARLRAERPTSQPDGLRRIPLRVHAGVEPQLRELAR